MQNLSGKLTGGSLTAAEWNQLPSEIQNIILSTGITLSSGDLNQLGKALSEIASAADFYIQSSGATNNYTLVTPAGRQQAPRYTNGMRIRWFSGFTNTGASTVNVNGLGARNLLGPEGGSLEAGSIISGQPVEAYYHESSTTFRVALSNFNNLTSDEITNNSSVAGSTVTDALETTDSTLNNFISDLDLTDVGNSTSNISGANASIAMDNLKDEIDGLGSDDIANDSSIAGINVSEAMENVLSNITPINLDILTSAQTQTLSTLLPLFGFPVSANTSYAIEMFLIAQNVETSGLALGISFGSIANSSLLATYNEDGTGASLIQSAATSVNVNSSGAAQIVLPSTSITGTLNTFISIKGHLRTGGSSGTANIRYALDGLSGSGTVVISAGSWIKVVSNP